MKPETAIGSPCPRCTSDEYTVTRTFYTNKVGKIYLRCYFCGLWTDEFDTLWFDSEEAENSHRNIYKIDKKIPEVQDIRLSKPVKLRNVTY